VITPWSRTMRRKTLRTALHRLEHMPAAEVYAAGNSYIGLARQARNSHTDQARIGDAHAARCSSAGTWSTAT
jgi:RNA-directed DNA polymerase